MKRIATIEYRHGKELGVGHGLNSRVYLVDDPQLGGQLAVKEIDKARFVNRPGFWHEAHAMFAADHDNVVPVRYACETHDHICLAMPFFKNGSLADRIASGPIRPIEVIRIGQDILSGLTQIHMAGRVHFDVKPSNVLFADSGHAMVADFGQSRSIGPSGVSVPGNVYSLVLPPEILTYFHGTVGSDVYQAGLTLYRAINGDPFFKAQVPLSESDLVNRITCGDFPDRGAFMPHVSRSLRTVVRKALLVDCARRYATATAFAQALARVEVHLDWATFCLPDNEIEWRALRQESPLSWSVLAAQKMLGASAFSRSG